MDTTYQYQYDTTGFGIFFFVWAAVILAVLVITYAGYWKMFVKAGRPGWAGIIPIYNWWVWVDIVERPKWWFWALLGTLLLNFIPLVGFVGSIAQLVLWCILCIDMAKRFSRGVGTGLGLCFIPIVFAPYLGFGSAEFDDGSPTSQGPPGWALGIDTPGSAGGMAPPAPSPMAMGADTYAPAPTTMSAETYAPAPTALNEPAPYDGASSPAPAGFPTQAPQAPSPGVSSAEAPSHQPVAPAPEWHDVNPGVQAPYALAPRTSPIPPLGFRGASPSES